MSCTLPHPTPNPSSLTFLHYITDPLKRGPNNPRPPQPASRSRRVSSATPTPTPTLSRRHPPASSAPHHPKRLREMPAPPPVPRLLPIPHRARSELLTAGPTT